MTEETLFTVALEIPDAADRGKFLDWACTGDAALRGRVGRLLDRHERASRVLARRAAAPGGRSADAGVGTGARRPDSPEGRPLRTEAPDCLAPDRGPPETDC